jgi:hypothetical protein
MKVRLDDGTVVEVMHRYALRIKYLGHDYSIGFEIACEDKVDRLIHPNSIERINIEGSTPVVSEEERVTLVSKVVEYCRLNRLTYRIA